MRSEACSKKGSIYVGRKRKMLQSVSFLNEYIPQNIKEIDLSQNFIEDIKPLHIIKLTNIILLDLSNNLILSLEGFNHGYYATLEKLYLYGNRINELQSITASKLPALKQLKLGFSTRGNQIVDLSSFKKSEMAVLQWLCLDSNDIMCINALLECPLKQLTHLYLSNNHLASIDYLIFSQTPKLKVLSAGCNYLTSISFLAKIQLEDLQYINLQDNQIIQIRHLFKSHLTKIQRLDLSNNLLSNETDLLKCHLPNISKIKYINQLFVFRSVTAVQIYHLFAV